MKERRVPPVAMHTSPNLTSRVSYWRRFGNSCLSSFTMHNPPRILVVDDSEANRDIIVTRLSPHGYEIIQAIDGEEALASARANLPDVVLLDITMPKMNGLEVCRQL